jgi:hydrogenase nickel incorporation protein HypA/HybF
MHEFSIMSQIVKAIIEEARKNKMITISKVSLQVGELTFLGKEQLKFCYDVLSKDNILSGSELIIEEVEPEVKCQACGFKGALEYIEKDEFHIRMPKFSCPKCDGKVEITKGKECVILDITGET